MLRFRLYSFLAFGFVIFVASWHQPLDLLAFMRSWLRSILASWFLRLPGFLERYTARKGNRKETIPGRRKKDANKERHKERTNERKKERHTTREGNLKKGTHSVCSMGLLRPPNLTAFSSCASSLKQLSCQSLYQWSFRSRDTGIVAAPRRPPNPVAFF